MDVIGKTRSGWNSACNDLSNALLMNDLQQKVVDFDGWLWHNVYQDRETRETTETTKLKNKTMREQPPQTLTIDGYVYRRIEEQSNPVATYPRYDVASQYLQEEEPIHDTPTYCLLAAKEAKASQVLPNGEIKEPRRRGLTPQSFFGCKVLAKHRKFNLRLSNAETNISLLFNLLTEGRDKGLITFRPNGSVYEITRL